jgi:hypothetical protein
MNESTFIRKSIAAKFSKKLEISQTSSNENLNAMSFPMSMQ